jgi:hypothetical protein
LLLSTAHNCAFAGEGSAVEVSLRGCRLCLVLAREFGKP